MTDYFKKITPGIMSGTTGPLGARGGKPSRPRKRIARKKVLSGKTKKVLLRKASKQEKKRLKEKATPPFKEKQFTKKWQRELSRRADEFSGEKPLNPALTKKLKAHVLKKRTRVRKLTADAKRRRN